MPENELQAIKFSDYRHHMHSRPSELLDQEEASSPLKDL